MRVLVCGSRLWTDVESIENVLSAMLQDARQLEEKLVIIEGGARGADSIAGQWAVKMEGRGVLHERYEADWRQYGRAAGPKRNKQMLDEGKPNVVVAFHEDIENSKGTSNMVSQAKRRNVEVIHVAHPIASPEEQFDSPDDVKKEFMRLLLED